ncbi:hypothetical protein ABPG75_000115 [Micractinium tetrahymenae]
MERVPYGGGTAGAGRWRKAPVPRVEEYLRLLGFFNTTLPMELFVQGSRLVPAQPGEVHFTWLQPAGNREALLTEAYQRAVEAAAREVAAAAATEVQHTGFGRHTLAWSWNVVVLPTEEVICRLEFGDVIVLSTGLVQACMRHSSNLAAALMFCIAHEMGHHVARHRDERCRVELAAQDKLMEAPAIKLRHW